VGPYTYTFSIALTPYTPAHSKTPNISGRFFIIRMLFEVDLGNICFNLLFDQEGDM
jgi:hypothetical protein